MSSSTGVKKLDEILSGGFPENSTILLRGTPGTGKSTLSQQFMLHGLYVKQSGIYITLDMPPEDVITNMKRFGDIDKFVKGRTVTLIDAYSWKIGGAKAEEWKKVLQGGLDINSLNVLLSEVLRRYEETRKRSVFDSVSTLLLYIPSDLVIRFIPILIAKCKQANSTQIMILEEGVHDDEIVNTLSYLADGVIEMKMEGPKRFMRITKMRGTSCSRDWLEYSIDDAGLEMHL